MSITSQRSSAVKASTSDVSTRFPSTVKMRSSCESVMFAGSTSRCGLCDTRIASRGIGSPRSTAWSVSSTVVWIAAVSPPSPEVALACGSKSMRRVRECRAAKAAARLIAVVVFPDPPF